MKTAKKRKPERLPFRVIKGGLQPADGYVTSRLRERGYRIGDTVMAVLTKARNPGYHRLAHRVGTLCVRHLGGFDSMNAHQALKRLQWETGIGCEEIAVQVPNIGLTMVRIPLSMSYENMDQGEFEEVVKGLCRHISFTYWPDLSPEQVQEMADTMPEEI